MPRQKTEQPIPPPTIVNGDPIFEAFAKSLADQLVALFNAAQFVSSQLISFSQNGVLATFTPQQKKILYENLLGAAALVGPQQQTTSAN